MSSSPSAETLPRSTSTGGKTPRNAALAKRRAIGRWVRRVALGALVLAIAGALAVAVRPKPVAVDVHAAARGPLRVTVDALGRTRVKDRYVVSAPLTGNVARIELQPGDAVAKGDVVARVLPLEPPLLDARGRAGALSRIAAALAAQRQAAASVARAEVALAQAQRQLATEEELARSGSTSTAALERVQFEERLRREELTSMRFAADVANHEVETARTALERLSTGRSGEQLNVTAPAAGRVLRVLNESGGAIAAGTQLLEIGDPAALEVVADVLTREAVGIPPSAHVLLERWGGDGVLRAHVRLVEPSAFTRLSALGVEEQRVNVVIDLDEPHERWATLGDGYRVEARIVTWEENGVLAVPVSALFRHGEDWAVFAVEGETARVRSVTTGRRNGTSVEIRGGLPEGAMVIVHPSERVRDGSRVAARATE